VIEESGSEQEARQNNVFDHHPIVLGASLTGAVHVQQPQVRLFDYV